MKIILTQEEKRIVEFKCDTSFNGISVEYEIT